MKISSAQRDLQKGIATVSRAVSSRTTLPILGNILIEAKGGEVRLAATNLAISINCWIAAKIEAEGAITVPAKLIGEMVSRLQTVAANHGAAKYRAFLVGDQNRQIADRERPAFVVCAKENGGYYPRAFLMPGGGNTNFKEAHPGKGCRDADDPAYTVTAISKEGGAMPRAWLVDGANARPDGRLIVRKETDPALTITTGGARHQLRSLLDAGRVVAMTPRALARFQSFPDWYELPDNARLAAKGIGNAVPPLLYQRLIAPLLDPV